MIVGVLVAIAIFQPSRTNQEKAPKVGFQAPAFELKGLDQNVHSLTNLGGKPVLINVWASWCGPCKEEAPDLVRLYEKYKDKIEFYAVNATSDDSLKGALSFVEQFQFSFPVLLDETGSFTDLYRVRSYPTTFFVDGNGTIRFINLGIVSPDSLERTIVQTIRATAGVR